jgi:hypothetical protein
MKILLVCEYWYGTGGYGYKRYLEQLGCDVEIFDYRRTYFSVGPKLGGISYFTRRINRKMMNNAFIGAVRESRPDVVFFLKGETIYESALRFVKETYKPILIQWYPDGPFNIEVKNATKDSIASIPLFDIYYIYAKSLIQPLKEAGGRRVEYLPFCYDPEMLVRPDNVGEEDRAKFATDVVFAGTWEPMREWWLERICDLPLSIWGNSWENAASKSVAARWRGNAV